MRRKAKQAAAPCGSGRARRQSTAGRSRKTGPATAGRIRPPPDRSGHRRKECPPTHSRGMMTAWPIPVPVSPPSPRTWSTSPRLVTAYYTERPDPADPTQQVAFGTSGHRGSSLTTAFNEDAHPGDHPGDLRLPARRRASTGRCSSAATPTRSPSRPGRPRWRCSPPTTSPCWSTAATATPRRRRSPTRSCAPQPRADDRAASPTASSSPRRTTRPRDGGFKYNPPNGGPADTDATGGIADRANELLAAGLAGRPADPVRPGAGAATTGRTTSSAATSTTCRPCSTSTAIRDAGVRIGADPLGGASVAYWGEIAERHGLDLTVVNPLVDPTWRFMTLDWDGKIRMDCSSPYAMASLIGRTRRLPDRHRQRRRRRPARHRHPGRRADEPQPLPGGGDRLPLRAPRPAGRADAAVGKTLVSSSMIDRVAAEPRPAAGRGAGRLQVVRARPARRLASASAARRAPGASFLRTRRQRLDHRQGRHPAGPARRRDPGRDRHGPQSSTTPTLTDAVRRPGVRPHRRAGRPRAEGDAGQAVARRR